MTVINVLTREFKIYKSLVVAKTEINEMDPEGQPVLRNGAAGPPRPVVVCVVVVTVGLVPILLVRAWLRLVSRSVGRPSVAAGGRDARRASSQETRGHVV